MSKSKSVRALGSALLSVGLFWAACSGGSSTPPPPPPICPDGVCTGSETADSCPEDCAPAVQCGDGTCDQAGGECGSCAEDCPASACEPCGNGVCLATAESCATCAEDCGDCLACGASPGGAAPNLTNAAICDFLDPAHCLLPFPSDFHTRADATTSTKKRLNFALEATPKNRAGVPVRPDEFNRADGFSPATALVLKVSSASGTAVDLEESKAPTIQNMGRSLELDSPIVVIDAETGERHPVWAELDLATEDLANQALFIRPASVFKEGRRYIAALRNLVDKAGQPIPAGDAFRVYRDCLEASDPAIEGRRGSMEAIFKSLARAGIKRADLQLAWEFTVASARSLSERLVHMRDQSLEAGALPKGIEVSEPPNDDHIFRVVTGSFSVPSYLSPPAVPFARLAYGPDGKPAKQLLPHDATFTCIVPRSVRAPDGSLVPSRLAIYGHQVLKTQAEVQSSNVKRLALEHNITFCATDWIGLAEGDTVNIATILVDISNFPVLTDRLHQAHLNFLLLGRMMKSEGGLAAAPAFRDPATNAPLIDTKSLYFFGEDQGGTLGVATSAVAKDWQKAVLSVAGIGYSMILTRSVNGTQFLDLAKNSYPDGLDVAIGLQLIQLPWDSTEASGYAQHLTANPYPETPAKQVLIHEVFGDHAQPNVLTELLARSVEAKLRVPALASGRSQDKTPFFALDPVPGYPFEGSTLFVWDAGAQPPDPENRPTTKGLDPHAAPGATPAMRAVTAQFMGSGGITDVCNDAPCVAGN